MSGSITLLAIFATAAIGFSFLCSLWESVLLSISPSHAHELEEEKPKIGLRLKEFKKNIDVPLAAILTLNTIANTVGAIGVGEQATRIWSESGTSWARTRTAFACTVFPLLVRVNGPTL